MAEKTITDHCSFIFTPSFCRISVVWITTTISKIEVMKCCSFDTKCTRLHKIYPCQPMYWTLGRQWASLCRSGRTKEVLPNWEALRYSLEDDMASLMVCFQQLLCANVSLQEEGIRIHAMSSVQSIVQNFGSILSLPHVVEIINCVYIFLSNDWKLIESPATSPTTTNILNAFVSCSVISKYRRWLLY